MSDHDDYNDYNDYDDYDTHDDGYGAASEPLFDTDAEEAADEAEAAGALDTTFNYDNNDDDDLDPTIATTLNYRTTAIDASDYDDDDDVVDDSRPLSSIPIRITSASTYVPRRGVDIDAFGGNLGELGDIIRQALVLNREPGRFVGDDFDVGVGDVVPADDGVYDPEEDEYVDEEDVDEGDAEVL